MKAKKNYNGEQANSLFVLRSHGTLHMKVAQHWSLILLLGCKVNDRLSLESFLLWPTVQLQRVKTYIFGIASQMTLSYAAILSTENSNKNIKKKA